jgi:hypothetical protein
MSGARDGNVQRTYRLRIVQSVFRSMVSGGRLVIVDRGPPSGSEEPHELPPGVVEGQIRQQGFEILSRDRFIDRPGDRLWWLIVASKP